MRHVVELSCVLALALSTPLSVSAEDTEESALRLELDAAGVEIAPSPARTPDGYTLEEMEPRVKRARRGLIASAVVYAAALPFVVAGFTTSACPIVSGTKLGKHKRAVRRLQGAHYETPPRSF
jgi:hypothetical protein